MSPGAVLLGLVRAGEPPSTPALSPAEQERLGRMRLPARAAQYLAGRWLLRRLGALASGLDMDAIVLTPVGPPVASGPDGRPFPKLSLTHSGDWVLGAACWGPCGVDLEQLGTGRDWPALARYLGLPDAGSEDSVLRHWTRFEAVYKAVYPPDYGVWRLDAPGYLGCLVAPPQAAVELRDFSGGQGPGLTLSLVSEPLS